MPRHHKHHSKSDSDTDFASKNANSFFKPHKTENKDEHCVQSVNVTVNVDQKDDGCTGCFKALVGAFRKSG